MAAMRARPPNLERLYTVEEFEKLPEFGDRYDLIDGRLVKRPVPSFGHSVYGGNIRDAFKEFNRNQPQSLGFMTQEASVRIGPRNAPTPDVSFWKAGHEPTLEELETAARLPDLAVEVHSPGDLKSPTALRSALVKVEKLVEAGVPVVWVVYPNRKEVEVYHADRGYRAGPVKKLGIGDVLEEENLIPGFRLPVADIFKYP